MPFLWLALDGPDGAAMRADLERNAIGLLSAAAAGGIDPASPNWLGTHSNRPVICDSGLWNVNHVGEEYDPAFLERFEVAIEDV